MGLLAAIVFGALGALLIYASNRMPRFHRGGSEEQLARWDAGVFADGPPLGVIQNISGSVAMLDLFVFSDVIAVARGSTWEALAYAVDGHAAGDAMAREQRAGNLGKSLERLREEHPELTVFPLDAVVRAELRKIMFGMGARLVVFLSDGSRASFEWKAHTNDFDGVQSLLEKALGPRLQLVRRRTE